MRHLSKCDTFSMSGSEIRNRAEACLSLFSILFSIQSVQVDGSHDSNLRTDEQRARFEIWAGNIGVFADQHASLDYRLRENDDARNLLTGFLGTLYDFLQRAKDSSEHNPSNSLSILQGSDGGFEQSASSAISSSFQGTETESLSEAIAENVSQFEQRLRGVEKSIDRLYRLSLQIRKPNIARRNAKADRFPILDEEGHQIDNEFTKYAVDFITHHYPKCDNVIKQRLAKGIATRRKRFLYLQSHQRKLNAKTVIALVEEEQRTNFTLDTDDVTTIRGTRMLADPSTHKAFETTDRCRPAYAPSHTSASALATTPIPLDKIMNDEDSRVSTVFTNVSSTKRLVSVPDPPAPIPGSKEFECPYCCMFLPISYVKPSKWRRHVLEDLSPYSCVFTECMEHQEFYSDKKAWIAHMQNAHTTRWTCHSPAHDPCSFNQEQDYDKHMRTEHAGAFAESQLPFLRKRSRVPALATFHQCPLCGYSPSIDELQSLPQARNSQGKPKGVLSALASDQIMKHLASHLESLAVKALPWRDGIEKAESEVAVSRHAEEGTGSDDEDLPVIGRSRSEGAVSMDRSVHSTTRFVIDDDTDEYDSSFSGSYDEEWGFLPQLKHYGRDRDPILQKFLRRLYFGSPPDAKQWKGPKLPAYLVPVDKDTNFFARSHALYAIEEALGPDPQEEKLAVKALSFPRCFAVHGPGGMGKTQVAAQFAESHREKFDAILWVHAENVSKIDQDFKDIAIALGLITGSADATDVSSTRDALKRWLVNPIKYVNQNGSMEKAKASWLLVFDGVEDGDVLNQFWPYDGPGSILVTSRNPYSWAMSIELKPFTVQEGTEYLLSTSVSEVPEEEKGAAVVIAQRLGGLPLALAQMSGIIAHEKISFTEFLRSYEKRAGQQELLQWTFKRVRPQSSKYEHNVASVWAFDGLGEGSTLLKVLSMLDPDGIPERLFEPSKRDTRYPQLLELKTNYRSARDELLARSLVTTNKSEKKLFVHRLVQDVSRTRMGSSELRKFFYLAVGLVSGRWPFEKFTWRHSVARWGECEELFPHVQRLRDVFQEVALSVDSFEDYMFANLLVDAGWYCHESSKFPEAVSINHMAQSICESVKLQILENPTDSDDNLSNLSRLNYSISELNHNRGSVAAETNELLNALKYHKAFNTSMVKELAGISSHDDMRLAISWNELGNAWMLNQNWAEGEKSYLKAIEEMERVVDFNPIMISLPLVNLGLAYWLLGKYDEALKPLQRGLKARQTAFGKDDRISFITGRYLHAIGNVKCSQGNYTEGRDYHHRALLHYKATLGNRHHRTADMFVRVADHSLRMHQYDMAVALLDHALEAYSNSRNFMPERLRASFKRVKALRCLDKVKEAEIEHSRCFKTYRELFAEMNNEIGPRLGVCKTTETDLTDDDIESLVAFWSR